MVETVEAECLGVKRIAQPVDEVLMVRMFGVGDRLAQMIVADLYRCRWSIETFFKQLKQTVQLVDFLGNNANAVKWQVWTALLVHLLLRFLAWRSRWTHSFTRLFTYVRAALWLQRDLADLLKRCGTADGRGGGIGCTAQSWLPGFASPLVGQHA